MEVRASSMSSGRLYILVYRRTFFIKPWSATLRLCVADVKSHCVKYVNSNLNSHEKEASNTYIVTVNLPQ